MNLVCPITQEPLGEDGFVHDGVAFETMALHGYLVACPGAVNPLTRAIFSDDDIRRLNTLAARFDDTQVQLVMSGRRAVRAKRRRERLGQNLAYLEGEAREVVAVILDAESSFEFDEVMADAAETLCDVCAEVMSTVGGADFWDTMCEALGDLVRARGFDHPRKGRALALIASVQIMCLPAVPPRRAKRARTTQQRRPALPSGSPRPLTIVVNNPTPPPGMFRRLMAMWL